VRRLTAWYFPRSRLRKTHVCIQSNAWWGFSNANDRQKIFAFIRRCIRTGFSSPDLADFHDLYISTDEKLFNKIFTCANHILRTLLPPPTAQKYILRNRPHNRQLPDRVSPLTDCNFTVRMLYRNMYWLLYILDLRFVLFLCTTAVWQFAIKEYVMLHKSPLLVKVYRHVWLNDEWTTRVARATFTSTFRGLCRKMTGSVLETFCKRCVGVWPAMCIVVFFYF